MFYITARRVHPGVSERARRRRDPREAAAARAAEPLAAPGRGIFWMNLPFRLVALTLIAVSVITLANQVTLLNAPLLFWLAGLWLCAAGLLTIALTRDAIKLGMGLLFFTSGFGIIYLSIDTSLLIYALLTLSDIVIALAISHIASAPGTLEGRRRGES
jgi:hypothetical protein